MALQAPRALRERVRRPRRLPVVLALIAALVFALAAFFLLPSRVDDAPAGGAPIAAPGATPLPTALRGRSTTPVPVVVVPTPPPTTQPTAAPTAVGVPGGTGGGGSPGGIVAMTRFIGRVIDSETGNGVPGVCVAVGLRECSENPVYTDTTGTFEIRLPSGSTWDINFSKAGYAKADRRTASTRTQAEVSMGSISITRR